MSEVLDLPPPRLAGELRMHAKCLSEIGDTTMALICNFAAAHLTPPKEWEDAVDLIESLMERTGLKRNDIFSSKARASEVMNRKRPLTLALIQKLHFEHGLPAEVLIRPYRASPTQSNTKGTEA